MTSSVEQLLESHRHCIFCGVENPHGLRLRFYPTRTGLEAPLRIPSHFQGYTGIAQGGIVAGVLDCAMAHCLFQQKVRALTARLNVRYRHEVPVETQLTVSAMIQSKLQYAYMLTARLHKDGKLFASAEGTFIPVLSELNTSANPR